MLFINISVISRRCTGVLTGSTPAEVSQDVDVLVVMVTNKLQAESFIMVTKALCQPFRLEHLLSSHQQFLRHLLASLRSACRVTRRN
ncbi:hypothetical protein HAX54_018067 [Datura stramonium]|uniref:Uncharacterized protein n=1 Tax=Datura stramonium TaxID=4076 RepID=A0ABS8S3B0_DATST|nr:hypothetical protein [Datura stramonium]